MSKLLVIRQHRSEYPNPITFEAGAGLGVGERSDGSPRWVDWFLCSTPDQEDGLAIAFLSKPGEYPPPCHGALSVEWWR
jgi:hypothetical protein